MDKIGVVRQHRWVSADQQAKVLQTRCRVVVSLGGGKLQQVERDGLVALARPGRVFEFVHAFLLADPRKKHRSGGLKADFRAALAALRKRGSAVADLDGSVCSEKHGKALLALVDKDITRSNQGAKSATNGARSRGRQTAEFTAAQHKEAKAVWRNVKDFPTWGDAEKELAKIRDASDQEFTTARAFKLWRGRT